MDNKNLKHKKPNDFFLESFLEILKSETSGWRVSRNKATWLLTRFRITKDEAKILLKQLESEGKLRLTKHNVYLKDGEHDGK